MVKSIRRNKPQGKAYFNNLQNILGDSDYSEDDESGLSPQAAQSDDDDTEPENFDDDISEDKSDHSIEQAQNSITKQTISAKKDPINKARKQLFPDTSYYFNAENYDANRETSARVNKIQISNLTQKRDGSLNQRLR